MTFDTYKTGKRIKVSLGNNVKTELIEFPTSDTEFIEIKVRWLPNGQLRVWLDKVLVLFENDFAPNTRTSVSDILFGRQSAALDPKFTPITYEYRFLKVKVLQEFNAAKELVKVLPKAKCAPEIPLKCIRKYQRRQVVVINELRNFMSLYSRKHTKNWSSGDRSTPFTSVATTTHLKARELALIFYQLLENPNASHAAKFLKALEDFVLILKNNLPLEYANMVDRLNSIIEEEEGAECQTYREAYYDQLDLKSRFIYDLLADAEKLIHALKPTKL